MQTFDTLFCQEQLNFSSEMKKWGVTKWSTIYWSMKMVHYQKFNQCIWFFKVFYWFLSFLFVKKVQNLPQWKLVYRLDILLCADLVMISMKHITPSTPSSKRIISKFKIPGYQTLLYISLFIVFGTWNYWTLC